MRISLVGTVRVGAFAAWSTFAALRAFAAPASAAEGCSNDAFVVRGTPLTVQICALPGRAGERGPASIVETLGAKGQPPLIRRVTLDAALGDEISRTIDDAPLASLGIGGTIHMTIAIKNGAARLEHALLVPGAIALK